VADLRAPIDDVVGAIQSGKPVIVPTDTVYGLCVNPYREEYARRLYAVKQRDPLQPVALVASDLDMLFECVPELRGRSGTIARAVLPGPYTLILQNPARRFRWLTGANQDAIGVRIPELDGDAAAVLARVGAVAATSANLPGGPDPPRLEDVPAEIRAGCAAELDGGELPGTPSTVIDCTGPEPVVVREGAGSVEAALATISAAR
jgi:tRNA threonylcarbamoyl adenosine modification protein (Sua5/YciO/YrdC/YwlC family)